MGLMWPSGKAMEHAFAPKLEEWAADGVPVDCSDGWSEEAVMAAVECGPHPTARTREAIDLFKEDIAYQVKAGFARVVPWEEVKRDVLVGRLPNLKISPVAVIPQAN